MSRPETACPYCQEFEFETCPFHASPADMPSPIEQRREDQPLSHIVECRGATEALLGRPMPPAPESVLPCADCQTPIAWEPALRGLREDDWFVKHARKVCRTCAATASSRSGLSYIHIDGYLRSPSDG